MIPALFFAASALAEPAPDLKVAQWIATGPAAEAEAPLQIVEVWATWCGPCHETFPMLTALQKTYGDRVRVIALTDDSASAVRRFFHANREQMGFAIAVTDSETMQSFMFGGFGGRGLPSVYVIDDGQMVWSGPPDELAADLEKRLATDPVPAPVN